MVLGFLIPAILIIFYILKIISMLFSRFSMLTLIRLLFRITNNYFHDLIIEIK